MRKKVYVVLGMSRTGTSAIARSLLTLGIDMGDRFIPGNNLNPKGFWEDKDIMHKINRGVSAAIDYTYLYMDSPINIESHPTLSVYKKNAISLLQTRLANTDYWGFKDPRTVTLMPFWHSVFKAIDVEDKYIIVVRNPLAAAHSNTKFIDCEMEEAMLIWLYQLYAAIDGTQNKPRIVVSYENMLQDPRLQLRRMHAALGIETIVDDKAVNTYAEEFLDKRLRHHDYSDQDYLSHSATRVAPLTIKLYDLLKKLARDDLHFHDEAFLTAWSEIKNDYQKLYPLHCYLDNVLKRNKQLLKERERLEKSVVWKMMYPIRFVDDYLRSRRKRKKEARRLAPVVN